MPKRLYSLLALTSAISLAACGAPQEEAQVAEPAGEAAAPVGDTAPAEPETIGVTELTAAIEGEWRGDRGARDNWRNPVETLEFLGINPSGTIVEIWPGGGWYADILAPWTAGNGGTYVAAHFEADTPSEYRRNSRTSFAERYGDTAMYGNVQMAEFGDATGPIVEPGTADTVLTFRNVHNWMMNGFTEKAFGDFYDALKPGGTLGVVEHRLPSTREQDPRAGSGYVQQAYVIQLAEEAGFEFVASSEINANPADTADHPFGVWTLPPVRRSAARGEEPAADFDRAAFDAIGESDRMTLLFRKPDSVE